MSDNHSNGFQVAIRLADHARRLQDSVQVMGMDTELNSEAYSRAVAEVLMGNSVAQNVHIRQMVFVEGNGEMFTKGPVGHAVVVTPKEGWFQGKDDGVHACVSSWQRIRDNSIPPRVKCAANYQNGRLALLRARLDGYDCALLLNDRGKVSEEPGRAVFLVRRNEIITPRITDDILESVTRETVITLLQDLCQREVIEREVDRTELYLAEEIFVCGTGFEVLPVLSIDRHAIGGGKPGEITTLVRNAYLNVARGEEPKYRHWLTPVYPKDGPGAQASPKESSTLQHGSDGPPLFRILQKVTDP